ncbi:MAG TPA: hypothetical protein VK302_17770 [Terriglobales bacterium]|nr:hypothetical protein [Terriglobales bacterium]
MKDFEPLEQKPPHTGGQMRNAARSLALTLAAVCIAASSFGQETATLPDPDLQELVANYIRLYTKPTLTDWKKLFHPSLIVANPNRDGSITIRNLDEFYNAQEERFATGRRISEHLENVSTSTGNRIGRINADFIFSEEGVAKRGKLGLHAIRDKEGWKIVAIIFSYD